MALHSLISICRSSEMKPKRLGKNCNYFVLWSFGKFLNYRDRKSNNVIKAKPNWGSFSCLFFEESVLNYCDKLWLQQQKWCSKYKTQGEWRCEPHRSRMEALKGHCWNILLPQLSRDNNIKITTTVFLRFKWTWTLEKAGKPFPHLLRPFLI